MTHFALDLAVCFGIAVALLGGAIAVGYAVARWILRPLLARLAAWWCR